MIWWISVVGYVLCAMYTSTSSSTSGWLVIWLSDDCCLPSATTGQTREMVHTQQKLNDLCYNYVPGKSSTYVVRTAVEITSERAKVRTIFIYCKGT